MLKAVVDTNIFISALLKSSNNRRIITSIQDAKFTLIISSETLDELIGVISRPKFHNVIKRTTAEKLIDIIKSHALLVKPRQKFDTIKNDFNDNRFLEAAVEGNANFILYK